MTGSIEAVPPNNLDAEAALLGSLLICPEQMTKVGVISTPSDFYSTANRRIFDAALTLHRDGKLVDPILLLSELDRRHELDEIGGRDYLATLVRSAGTGANAEHYARLLRDLSLKREMSRLAAEMDRAARNGVVGTDAATQYARALLALRDVHAEATENPFGAIEVTETDQTPWLVRGYLARRAVTLLTALPKCGKTTLAYAIAASLQQAKPDFTGLASPEPCDVLVLSEEDDGVLSETFRATGVDASRVLAITRRKAFPRRPLAQDVDFALKILETKPSIGLVIVDTWAFWANLPDKGGNDRDTVLRAYQEILRLASAGVAVLLIHHSKKSDGEEGTAASGSNALVGSVDIILELRRFGSGDKNTLRSVKAYGRFQRIPPERVIEWHDGQFSDMGEADDARHKVKETRLLSCLVNCARWLSTEEVSDATGMKDSAVVEGLRTLYQRKQIQRIGKGARGSPFMFASLDVPLHRQIESPGNPPG